MKYQSQIDETTYQIEINEDGSIVVDGEPVSASLLQVGALGLYSLLVDSESTELVVEETQRGYRVMLGSRTFDVNVADERELRLAGGRADLIETGADLTIKAPIPGLVIRVMVGVGDQVEAKQPLVILEAMKMENELRAPRAGIITDVRVKAGESVEQGAGLLVLS